VLRFKIPVDELRELYLTQNLSTYKISLLYNCNRQTISNYLTIHNIPHKTKAQAQLRYYNRNVFDGSLEDKAYLIGFRLGDLNVYKPKGSSETIVARCHSTSIDQVILIEEIFSRYGKVKVSESDNGYTINCYLNLSFEFLLEKQDIITEWITLSDLTMWAFIAGYIDAEGCFQINQGRGRFAVTACDKNILSAIHIFLVKFGLTSIYRKVANQGEKSIGNYLFSNDVWRININEANSLCQFIHMITPYIKHRKRLKDMNIVLKNIMLRNRKGTI